MDTPETLHRPMDSDDWNYTTHYPSMLAGHAEAANLGYQADNITVLNTTSTLSDYDTGQELVPCGVFFFVVYGPLCGLVCLFGLIGNILSFSVLHKYSRNNVATYLLKSLAITDGLFLATATFVQMYPAMSMYFNLTEQLRPIYPQLQKYAWPIAHIVQMGTTYMMVLVAVNRYIAVCKPLHAPRLCTKRQVQVQIIILTLGIITYNVPRFFEYNYVKTNITNDRNETVIIDENVGLIRYTVYNILYEIVSYCLFVFLIPLLILLVLNLHLIRELKRAQKNRKAMANRKNTEENNITLVIIVIILVFIVCQSPASINQILFYTKLGQSETGGICTSYEMYYHISNLLIITNSAVNFIIYCLFRRQFQQELLALFCCVKPRNKHNRNKPLRRTLLLRALHEHSHTFGNNLPKNISNVDNTNITVLLNEPEYTTEFTSVDVSGPGTASSTEVDKAPVRSKDTSSYCNGTNGHGGGHENTASEKLLKET